MGKKIRIYESEIKRATRRKLMEKILVEDYEMKDTYSKSKFKPTPRERGIEGVFGQYGEEMDPAVIRYMRKNPNHILRRMAKLYPEIYMRHMPAQPDYGDYSGPIDVTDQYDEEDYYIDEATEMNVTQYDLTDEKDVKELNDKLDSGLDTKKLDVGMNKAQYTNESTRRLFKKFLNRK